MADKEMVEGLVDKLAVEAMRHKDDMAMLRSAIRSVLVTALSSEATARPSAEQEPAYTSTDAEIRVYTDGSCLDNPGAGGWGVIIVHEDGSGTEMPETLCGGEALTTNNRMELMAAIKALGAFSKGSKIALFTDSKYVSDGIGKWIHGWKKRNWKTSTGSAVKNADLWVILDELNQGRTVRWNWVKAHNGDKYNEMADKAAREQAELF